MIRFSNTLLLQLEKLLTTSNPENVARLVVPVNILFILLLAYSLARLSWLWLPLPAPTAPTTALTADTSPLPTGENKNAQLAAIVDWHLFGKPDIARSGPVAPPPPQQAPETKLNLKLEGIFFSENRQLALAIISDSGGPECPNRIGDYIRDKNCNPVPHGPRLEKIFVDKVVLSHKGNLETLSLPREPLSNDTKPAANAATLIAPVPAARGPATINPPVAVPNPPAAANPPMATANPPIDAARMAVERLRSQVTRGPTALQELINTSPYMQNGQFLGFRLQPGRDQELFRRLGLQAGDVITQVNGVPLTDPVQGRVQLQGLLNADQANIQVLRNGTELTLVLPGPG
jgi:general secretion pathway protein C